LINAVAAHIKSKIQFPVFTAWMRKACFTSSPNISKTRLKSTDFCAKLLEAEKVAAVPGIAFGADGYIRLSYATSMVNLEKGLERIERFCKTLVK
jgi:aspartate aminotransferase